MHQLRVKLFLFFLLISACSFGKDSKGAKTIISQKSHLDSIEILLKHGKLVCDTNCELGILYSLRALKIALRINNLPAIAKTYNSIGIAYKILGNYSKSLEFQLKSLNTQISLKDKKGIAHASNNVSVVYSLKNDFINALDYQLKSISLKEEIGDIEGLAISYENLGRVYTEQRNSSKALGYYMKALELNKKFRDTAGIIYDYVKIGDEYRSIKNYSLARSYLEKALDFKIRENVLDKETSEIYNDLANLDTEVGRINIAIEEYKKSLQINIRIKDKRNIAISYANIGSLLIDMKKFDEAEFYLVKSLEIAVQINANDLKISIYEMLMNLYERKGNWNKAFEYSILFKKISDENSKQNNFEKLNELEIKYGTEKKEKEISLLNKDKILKTKEISFQKTVKNYLSVISIIILFFLFFIYRLYQNKQKDNILLVLQKKEIEIQKKSITDSINYAYRIQKSILPSLEHFHEILPQSFVFNKPKDIVSGDFYWLHETSPFKYSSVNSKVLLAMADCTGHGVPGAFMSMIGVELLNEAVNESHSPAKILQIVDEGIRKALHTNNVESKKDGMDMALCAFDFDKNVLKYCGANRPIYRIRNGEMEIFAPQKTAVGFSEQGFVFENREIDIQIGDSIYLFSDGYADQFGGDRDKKLTTKKFKDLLMSIQTVPMTEQGKELENFIREWAGKSQQVDDMLVIGLKV